MHENTGISSKLKRLHVKTSQTTFVKNGFFDDETYGYVRYTAQFLQVKHQNLGTNKTDESELESDRDVGLSFGKLFYRNYFFRNFRTGMAQKFEKGGGPYYVFYKKYVVANCHYFDGFYFKKMLAKKF